MENIYEDKFNIILEDCIGGKKIYISSEDNGADRYIMEKGKA